MHFWLQIQVFTLKSHLHMDAAILFCTAVSSNWILLMKYYFDI